MLTQVGAAAAATDRMIVIEGGAWRSLAVWCELCGSEVEMIPSGDFASLSHVSPQAIARLAEAGAFHTAAGADGDPLLCLNSPLRIVPRSNVLNNAAG